MKIEAEFIQGLYQTVSARQGDAYVAEAKAQEALEKAQATVQQAIGGIAVLQTIIEQLNRPEPPPSPQMGAQAAGVGRYYDDRQPDNLA